MGELDPLAADLGRLAAELGGELPRKVLTAVGVEARNTAEDHAAVALGSDRRFSGWRKPPVGAGFEFVGDSTIELAARPNGPAVVANDGRRRGRRKARRGRYRGRTIGWGPTKGRAWWDRTVADIEEDLPATVEREALTELHRIWGS